MGNCCSCCKACFQSDSESSLGGSGSDIRFEMRRSLDEPIPIYQSMDDDGDHGVGYGHSHSDSGLRAEYLYRDDLKSTESSLGGSLKSTESSLGGSLKSTESSLGGSPMPPPDKAMPSTRRQGQSTRRQGQEISMPFFEDDFAEMSIIRKLMERSMPDRDSRKLTERSMPDRDSRSMPDRDSICLDSESMRGPWEEGRGESYRVAVQTEVPDDGRNAAGKPKKGKKKDKKWDFEELKKEFEERKKEFEFEMTLRARSDPSDTNLTSQIGKSGTQRSSTRQASGYLDHLGGELSIPAHNVKLSIPPGALEDVEEISIEVFSDLPNGINLQDNEITASFGFRCFPSGSSFKKPLTLSMPHCAVFYDNAVVEMVLHFGRDDEGEIMRIPLESNTYVIHSDRIVLQLDHFSWGLPTFISNWWNSGGNSDRQTTKRMLCTPFIPKTLPKDQDHSILRLCVYNKLPGLSEEILAEEMRMNYMQINPEEELIVNEDSIDMSISCKLDELPSTQTKDITTKELMQLNKLTVYMDLLKRRSLVTLIIKQERSLTMKFWTNIEEVSPSVGEVEGMITKEQSLPLRAPPPRSPHTGYTREVSPGALVQYVPPQEEESTQQGACRYQRRLVNLERDPDCLTDDQLVDISSKLPLDKFSAIAVKLGSTMTEAENIRDSSNKAEKLYFTVFTRWQERTGAPRRQLIDVLRSVKLSGIVQSIGLDNDSPQEDIESITL